MLRRTGGTTHVFIYYYIYHYTRTARHAAANAECCSSVAALLQQSCSTRQAPAACCCGECRKVSTSIFTSIIYYRYDYIAPKALCCSSVAALLQAYPVFTSMFIRIFLLQVRLHRAKGARFAHRHGVANAARSEYVHIYYYTIFANIFNTTRIFTTILWRTPPGQNGYIFTTILYSLLYLQLHEYLLPYCGERRQVSTLQKYRSIWHALTQCRRYICCSSVAALLHALTL